MTTEAEDNAAFNRRMELTQLCAGHVLDADDALAIQELFDDYNEDGETYADAFADGQKIGREEAGGKTIAKLLEERDVLRLEVAVQKALVRFAYADRDALRSTTQDAAGGDRRPDGEERG